MRLEDATPEDLDHWARHPVFITDDDIIPTCDLCEGPQYAGGDNWNGETGNHFSCEERAYGHVFVALSE